MGQAPPASELTPVTAQVTERRSRVATVCALALAVLGLLLAVASVPLYALTQQNWLVNGLGNVAVAVLFEAVGFIVAVRQPRNPIGWVLLAAPIGAQLLPSAAASYAELAFRLGYHLPLGTAALLLSYSWTAGGTLPLLVILLFPDGRVPSPRWRPVLWAYLAVVAVIIEACPPVGVAERTGVTPAIRRETPRDHGIRPRRRGSWKQTAPRGEVMP